MRNLSRVLLFIILILTLPGVVRAAMGIDEAEVDRAKVADAAKYYFYGWFLGEAVAGWDDIQVSLIPVYYFDGSLEGYCAILYWGKGKLPTINDFRSWSKDVYDFEKEHDTAYLGDGLSINDRLRHNVKFARAQGEEGVNRVYYCMYLEFAKSGIGSPQGGQGLPEFFSQLYELEKASSDKAGVPLRYDKLLDDHWEPAVLFTDGSKRLVLRWGCPVRKLCEYEEYSNDVKKRKTIDKKDYIPRLTWDNFDYRIKNIKKTIPKPIGGALIPYIGETYPEEYQPMLRNLRFISPDEAIAAVVINGDDPRQPAAGAKVYEPIPIGYAIGPIPMAYMILAYKGEDSAIDEAIDCLTTELGNYDYFNPVKVSTAITTLEKNNKGLFGYIVSGWIWDGPILTKCTGIPKQLSASRDYYKTLLQENGDIESIAWFKFSPTSNDIFCFIETNSETRYYRANGNNITAINDSEMENLFNNDISIYFNHYKESKHSVKQSRYSWERVFKTDISKYIVDGNYRIKD